VRLQTALHAVFPPECLTCEARVDTDFALCGACWIETPFITGAICQLCGVGLPGADEEEDLHCDDCRSIARPWHRGRAVFSYGGNARSMVLALKHGDRPAIARAAGGWLARAAAPLVTPQTVIVPIPLHWMRLAKRRYNQSALLAQALGRAIEIPVLPDAIQRHVATASLDGLDREARFKMVSDCIRPHPRHSVDLVGKDVILVDDVMTSGATFAAATEACRQAGAITTCVIALARVAKDA
jgi:ComF family protein